MPSPDRGPTVIVVGGGLGGPDLSASAQRALAHIGVEVHTGMGATDAQHDHVMSGDQKIPTYTTLWAGLPAWLAWLFVHLLFLIGFIGFQNRLLVLMQWATSYLSYERGARLITGPWRTESLSSGTGLGD